MKKPWRLNFVLPVVLILSLLPLITGFAYLDPGTGSLLVQIAIAAVLAAVATFKRFKSRILKFFRKDKGENG